MLLGWLHFAEQEGADDDDEGDSVGDGVDASASPVAFGAISNSECVKRGMLLYRYCVVIGLDSL